MKVIKTATVGNMVAKLFADGTVAYAGDLFPNGKGANLSVLRALGVL